jgi:hypothetical protein
VTDAGRYSERVIAALALIQLAHRGIIERSTVTDAAVALGIEKEDLVEAWNRFDPREIRALSPARLTTATEVTPAAPPSSAAPTVDRPVPHPTSPRWRAVKTWRDQHVAYLRNGSVVLKRLAECTRDDISAAADRCLEQVIRYSAEHDRLQRLLVLMKERDVDTVGELTDEDIASLNDNEADDSDGETAA